MKTLLQRILEISVEPDAAERGMKMMGKLSAMPVTETLSGEDVAEMFAGFVAYGKRQAKRDGIELEEKVENGGRVVHATINDGIKVYERVG